ncbi:hypothetical protein FEM48_Zijuj05G0122200 [Ziziphus jujuba var. spinosa]|uniref:DDE Tnp4 domain-containing protein n=1 Tax=Ziziphus jujuba var. spinosa TaxID=714518 RepID=A0A978VER7_ZIZJJ|nr:hypothetical protein FEM48_Zijuj05G0122200 [Ziziphus jujuba var. spinosa]
MTLEVELQQNYLSNGIRTAVENRNKNDLGCSIPEVIDMLCNISGIENSITFSSSTKRYPRMKGYLGPYKGERYHLPDFRCAGLPRGKKEQVKIVIASMALHNFIRIHANKDQEFSLFDNDEELLPTGEEMNGDEEVVETNNYGVLYEQEMNEERDHIANFLMFR